MKSRVLFGIAGAVIVAGIVGWFFFFRSKPANIPGKVKMADLTAWKYDKAIAEPISGTSGADKDLVLGDLDTNKAPFPFPKARSMPSAASLSSHRHPSRAMSGVRSIP